MKAQPTWVNKALFPFESKWIDIDGHQLHYVDEGTGETILFVHGTPEWSFGFRDLIHALRSEYRCVAMDHLGFGLSDKPEFGNYTCPAHAERLRQFIEKLKLTNLTFVANDFGGAFAMSYAITHPRQVARIVLFNTWMWSLREDRHYSGPARFMTSWLGKFLYLQLNFPVNVVMPAAYGNKKMLTKEVHRHYKKALPSPAERVGAYAFTHELMGASPWWQSLWNKLEVLGNKPILIFWGLKDQFVPPAELEKWKTKLPHARAVTFEDAGHFVQEEKPAEMAARIRAFMAGSD